jgi:hypothetical protein
MKALFAALAASVLLIGLPLLGVALAGKPLGPYLEFPPVTRYVVHASFSWPVSVGLGLFSLACVAPFVVAAWRGRTAPSVAPARRLPWWGWAGVAFTALAWVIAWNRFDGLAAVQRYTFPPLWLGYIVVVNGLVQRRAGSCPLTARPVYLAALFAASAAFWWFFEYLNRFVQNWYYVDVGELTAGEYFWQATLPFSTVLPAVASTHALLATFPRLGAGLDQGWVLRMRRPRAVAALVLAAAAAGLAGVGVWPDLLFPLLWIAPLLVLAALLALAGRPTVFSGIARGDWREIWLWALAALCCGFFWEMWNVHSLAKWQYAVPYVERFRIFEMPVLGYAGYLPFGLECALICQLVNRALAGRD